MKTFNDFIEEQQKKYRDELEDFDDEDESEFDYDVCYECAGSGGISSTTGKMGSANLKGKFGISCTTGICGGACVENANCVAVAWWYYGRAKGVIGSYLVLANWCEDVIIDAQIVKVDGKKIKADTWYTMMNGEIVEA